MIGSDDTATMDRREGRTRPSRRALLAGAIGAASAFGVGIAQNKPRAQSGAPSGSASRTFSVGAADVTVISDGAMEPPIGLMLPGRERSEIDTLFRQAGQTFSGLHAAINVAVVKLGADIILIDAGGGPDFMPTLGKLAANMEAAGIKPEALTKVVLTHAHPDHLWGVIDPFGTGTMYEAAQHVMAAAEFDFWMRPDVDTLVPDALRGIAAGTHRRLKSIADRVKPVMPGSEIAPGLQIVDTGGHTPGHVSVLLRSGTEQLLIGSDVLTQHVVSFAAPDWKWGPDMDGDKASASRRRILDQLATDRIALLGYHLPWPGLGRVERSGSAYRYVGG